MYFPDLISRAETVAAGSGVRSEGLGRFVARGIAGVRWLPISPFQRSSFPSSCSHGSTFSPVPQSATHPWSP